MNKNAKRGRKKATKKVARIDLKTDELEFVNAETPPQEPQKLLNNKGFGIVKDRETGRYKLIEIMFDDDCTESSISKVEWLGKACHPYQAEFEIKKLIAHGKIIPE